MSHHKKNIAAFMHLSTFTKYFFPFGNFIAPLLLWVLHKEKPYLNAHGREAINFQLSILVYTIGLGIICLPFFFLFVTDFVSLTDVIEQRIHNNSWHSLHRRGSFIFLFVVAAIILLGLFVFELYVGGYRLVFLINKFCLKFPLEMLLIFTENLLFFDLLHFSFIAVDIVFY